MIRSVLILLCLALPLRAEEETPEKAELGTIHVRSSEDGPLKRHEIIKTEVIRKEAIEHKGAQTLADAVSNQVGVDAQNSCANCGSKRVTINGMRGEHTTVLVDGMPMHSAISSFYGMDAVPVVGIESIEVSRGAGASLVAPEAIGGVLNIITIRPKETGIQVNGNIGTQRTGFLSVLGTVVGDEGKYRLILAGQLSHLGMWDVDGNKVSEAPSIGNQSFFVKGSTELGSSDRLEARYALQTVDILGGTTDGTRPTSPLATPLSDPLFQDSDVRKPYLDTQDKVTDVVGLTRQEAMARWNHSFNSDVQLQLSSSLAEQKQTSIYMHGYDYRNRDLLFFNDARVLFSLGDSHFLTLGAELKNQDMTSQSDRLYGPPKSLTPDDFKYRSRALYLQNVWVVSDSFELSGALRVDHMAVDRLRQTAQTNEIEETLLAPRVHMKWQHAPQWTSRLMYGRGYRPPLSFFESQHGLNEDGFTVDITAIEKSHSAGYSLSFGIPGLTITGSTHHTWIDNMAYAEEVDGSAATFKNHAGTLRVWANDIVASYDVLPNWNLALSYENFNLQSEYKSLLPAAAMEQRARLVSDLHFGNWEFVNAINWVGARDLRRYRYDRHYNALVDNGLGPELDPANQKWLDAPSFFTWDIYLGWTLKNKYTFYASVQNALDYTQAGAGDSPLNWAAHGNHYHLDNNHTWGPLRGRVFAVGLKVQL